MDPTHLDEVRQQRQAGEYQVPDSIVVGEAEESQAGAVGHERGKSGLGQVVALHAAHVELSEVGEACNRRERRVGEIARGCRECLQERCGFQSLQRPAVGGKLVLDA